MRDCVKAYNRELQRKHSVTEIGDLLVAEFSLTSCTYFTEVCRCGQVRKIYVVTVTRSPCAESECWSCLSGYRAQTISCNMHVWNSHIALSDICIACVA